jgi:hypothetical protein
MVSKTVLSAIYRYQERGSGAEAWQDGTWQEVIFNGSMEGSNSGLPLNTETDDGNAWFMTKTWTDFTISNLKRDWGPNRYSGPFSLGTPITGLTGKVLPIPAAPSDQTVISTGATYMSRCIPTNPAFDAANAIGELRQDGLPNPSGVATWRNRTHVARSAGDEYLNVEFGWLPFVSDLKSFANVVNNHHALWEKYRKGSSHKTRVGYSTSPSISNMETDNVTWGFKPSYVGTAHGPLTSEVKLNTWFKGAFKYFIPEPIGFDGKMAYWRSQARLLYGLELTPETVWNLAPWSWATDWFANTGDVLHNISRLGQDGLALQYGYVMSDQLRTWTGRAATPSNPDGSGLVYTGRTDGYRRCRRIPATPYGFGVSWNSLTSTQLAVIAALGLSQT